MPKKTIILNLKKWGVVIKSWTKNKKEKWKPKCNCKKKKKREKKSTWASIEIKTKNFPYQILVLWSSGNKSKQKNRWSTTCFFLLLFFLFCLVLCLVIVIWAILTAKPDYATRPLLLLLHTTTIYAKCAICVQCISNHVLKTLPSPYKKQLLHYVKCHKSLSIPKKQNQKKKSKNWHLPQSRYSVWDFAIFCLF